MAALLVLAIVTGLLTVAIVLVPHLIAPLRQTSVKQMPYESGMDPVGDARGRFDVRFYLVAIMFLIFDVELLFLYPWAVASWHRHGLPSVASSTGSASCDLILFEVLTFIALLFVAYCYAWRRGVLRWR